MNLMNKQMTLTGTYSNSSAWEPKPGSTTWHKRIRCTVVAVDRDSYAQPMVIVMFDDGTQGIYKTTELGLRHGETPARPQDEVRR
jgi:hypothetical protein